MTLQEVALVIKQIGVPCAYHHFKSDPKPPYLVYYYPGENDFMADDGNYVNIRSLTIDLFTRDKDFALEGTVEAALRDAGLSWYKNTDFLKDDDLFATTYEMEVLINGE